MSGCKLFFWAFSDKFDVWLLSGLLLKGRSGPGGPQTTLILSLKVFRLGLRTSFLKTILSVLSARVERRR